MRYLASLKIKRSKSAPVMVRALRKQPNYSYKYDLCYRDAVSAAHCYSVRLVFRTEKTAFGVEGITAPNIVDELARTQIYIFFIYIFCHHI